MSSVGLNENEADHRKTLKPGSYTVAAHVSAFPEPNSYLASKIEHLIGASEISDESMEIDEESRTELDSHANMCVVGRHCAILTKPNRYANVNAFSPSIEKLARVPIVDAAIIYECPYKLKSYVLVMKNALYVKEMSHNLIPPFVMREAGLFVSETAKIHVAEPSVDTHCIRCKDPDLRIPLGLWGIFSYFPSRSPSKEELEDDLPVIFLTPDTPDWNPNSDCYACNEESMLDWRGEIIEKKDRHTVLLEESDIGAVSGETLQEPSDLSVMENKAIDAVLMEAHVMAVESNNYYYDAELCALSPSVEPLTMCLNVNSRLEYAKFSHTAGSTYPDLTSGITDELFAMSAVHAENPRGVSSETLMKIWDIDEKVAKRTIEVTSQLNRTNMDNKLSRNVSTNDRMLRYRRLKTHFFSGTFFVTKKAVSTRGNTCMQMYVSDKGFVFVAPMKSKSEFIDSLRMFAKEVGVPYALVVDPAGEQTSSKVKLFCQQIGTTLRMLEEGTQWANRAELYIGLFKEGIRKDMRTANSPLVLWDYCAERKARIHNLTARGLFQLEGQNPYTATFGEEGDISNVCTFGWYEWCYFRNHSSKFPFPQEEVGRVLGPAKNAGNEMAQWVLRSNGNIVPRRTLRRLKPDELTSSSEALKRQQFDELIQKKLGDSMSLPKPALETPMPLDHEYDDQCIVEEEAPPAFDDTDPVDSNGVPYSEQSLYDRLIHAEVALPQGETMQMAKVRGVAVDADGNKVGTFHENPMLNTVIYDVEFPDGMVRQYAANTIAENILSQVDNEGHSHNVIEAIIDFETDGHAVKKGDEYIVTSRGRKRVRHTTSGWKLLVLWKNGQEEWVPLKRMKEIYPLEVADFAKSTGIDDQPAFSWWVPYTLRKRDRVISAINARMRRTTHKYGIEIPRNLEEARALDKKNGNDLWEQAIRKEMYNCSIAFQILEEGEKPPPGWKRSSGHMIFDVKMDFTRKARWVKDGHRTEDPDWSTYAGYVTRDSVRIALTYAALNGLGVTAADIKNAYLQAPASERHYIICGPEFGIENIGRVALIKRALYGGKSAGHDFWVHLRSCMEFLGFDSCKADPDLWMRPKVKSDGSEYFEYVLLYCDDTLVISEDGESVLMNEIGKYFELKEESIGVPSIYLGGKVRQVTLENGANAWSFSSSQYVQAAVENVEQHLLKQGLSLPAKAKTPFTSGYRPEVDTSSELGPVEASYYMSLIGVLWWMVELGRVDIAVEVSLMSSHMAMPRSGHLQQLYRIFTYLKTHHNTEMVFDPSEVSIDHSLFDKQDWTNAQYGVDVKEELPSNAPVPRGQGFTISAYVDSDHAGDMITRRSPTGFLVYCNCALIYWQSKKQGGVETSSFGAEFTAGRTVN